MGIGACVFVVCLSDFACSGGTWMWFDFEECVGCACGVVEAMLWRKFGVKLFVTLGEG
jgi:hypothetical protein